MVRYSNNLPFGAVPFIKQTGGCPGPYGTPGQNGGFPIIPALAAAYAGLKSVQPFTKANAVLRDNFGEHKNSIGYKIADKVTGIGKSLGIGPVVPISQYQPLVTVRRKPGRKPERKPKSKKGKSKKHKSILG